jgi:Cytochrome c554 and c-prime
MRGRPLRPVSRTSPILELALLGLAATSCGRGEAEASGATGGASAPSAPSIDSLACAGCHPDTYQAWSLSMHARAADDPIFLAMNARGQRETGGQLGDFCVRCHAPLAVARHASVDGSNLEQIPATLRGVTCVVCHTATDAENASLALADDGVMRGPIADAIANPAHGSTYSPSLDRDQPESAAMCGICHAVTNTHGLEVERTLDEWRATTYAEPASLRTCGRCHMPESTGVAAAVAGAPPRPVHGHAMPGVDLGPASPAQTLLVQEMLDPAISSKLCVVPDGDGAQVRVTLENARVGHSWPSGATQNRRAWLELVAYAGNAVLYASGVIADDEAVTTSASRPLVLLREQLADDNGNPTLFMWSAQTAQPHLLATAAADPTQSTITAAVQVTGLVDRVTSRVHVRPVDHDVADALVASGDLPPDAASALPTLAVGATVLEWTSDRGPACLP